MTAEREAIVSWLLDDADFHRKKSGEELMPLRSRLAHQDTANTLEMYALAIRDGRHLKESTHE